MQPDRRRLLALSATATAAAVAAPQPAAAAPAGPISALGIDAAQFGLRPGSNDDQTRNLQRAVDECARTPQPARDRAGRLSRRQHQARRRLAARRRARRDAARPGRRERR